MADLVGDTTLEYEVVRSSRRTLGIEITSEGRVVVRAPTRAANWRIRRLVDDKSAWIIRHMQRISRTKCSREFTTGELLPFRGGSYPLRVELDGVSPRVAITGGVLTARIVADDTCALKTRVRDALHDWYLEQAREILPVRSAQLAAQTGIVPAHVGIRNQIHRWGSCSVKDRVNLNWKLVMAPPDVADYVIIHELCHIKVRNHSRTFWELVRSFIPDYRERRSWLRENGLSLDL